MIGSAGFDPVPGIRAVDCGFCKRDQRRLRRNPIPRPRRTPRRPLIGSASWPPRPTGIDRRPNDTKDFTRHQIFTECFGSCYYTLMTVIIFHGVVNLSRSILNQRPEIVILVILPRSCDQCNPINSWFPLAVSRFLDDFLVDNDKSICNYPRHPRDLPAGPSVVGRGHGRRGWRPPRTLRNTLFSDRSAISPRLIWIAAPEL